ncbi:hypothetical protein BaRGS_00028374, partial [Batillaria attramentaria]
MLASVLLLLATLASAEACQCKANMYDNLDEYCKFDVGMPNISIIGYDKLSVVHTLQLSVQVQLSLERQHPNAKSWGLSGTGDGIKL